MLIYIAANCQKAQLRIYDGYEHSLEDHAVLKKFCGDTRFYKVGMPFWLCKQSHVF